MSREKNSRIRRRHGCLGGCLTRLIAFLGFLALLFVGIHFLGLVQNDDETGQPRLTFGNETILPFPSDFGNGFSTLLSSVPSWPYHMKSEGLTLKILRGGKGQALLLCCDGYTAIIGGGSGAYSAGLQMLLCGVSRLDAAIAASSDVKDTGGMAFAIQIGHPSFLFYTDTQTRTSEWTRMVEASQKSRCIVPTPGLSFNLGRGRITFIGPGYYGHADDEDDSLSLRIDYGTTGILVPGRISGEGESELLAGGTALNADILVVANGDASGTMGNAFLSSVAPTIAVCTGEIDWRTRARLQSLGARVYTILENGVMTISSDGTNVVINP